MTRFERLRDLREWPEATEQLAAFGKNAWYG